MAMKVIGTPGELWPELSYAIFPDLTCGYMLLCSFCSLLRPGLDLGATAVGGATEAARLRTCSASIWFSFCTASVMLPSCCGRPLLPAASDCVRSCLSR